MTSQVLTPEEHAALEEYRDGQAQQEALQELRIAVLEGDITLKKRRVLAAAAIRCSDYIRSVQDTKVSGRAAKLRNWLRVLPADTAGLIAANVALDRLSAQGICTVLELTREIGKQFELEARVLQLIKVDPMQGRQFERDMEKAHYQSPGRRRQLWMENLRSDKVQEMQASFSQPLSQDERVQLGKEGVQALIVAELVESRRVPSSKGVRVELFLHPEIEEYLTQVHQKDVQQVRDRMNTGMLRPPEPWTNMLDGGYFSAARKARNGLVAVGRMRQQHIKELEAELTAEKRPELFRAVNYLQGIPYQIHEPTRAAIVRIFQQGGGVLQIPRAAYPDKPECPFPESWVRANATPEEQAVFSEWLCRARMWHLEEVVWRRDVRTCSLFMRRIGREKDAHLWFPAFIDSRGRFYYRGNPNPQGDDKQKAVLHFAEKKPLGPEGMFWIKVQIANSLGYDKVPLQERVQYVQNLWPSMERALDAPEDAPEVFGTDSPWCVFTAAWELREALRSGNPEAYCTGLPVHQDASCSGHQFWALLMRDPQGAFYTNLTPTAPGEPKRDIYSRVSEEATQAMQRCNAEDQQQYRAFWMKRGIGRSEAKPPVMTYVYSATQRSQAQHLENTLLQARAIPFPMNSYRCSLYAVKQLFKGVEAVAPAAVQGMKYVQNLTREARKAGNEVLRWTSPLGMPVIQDYPKFEIRRVMLRSCGVQEILTQRITPEIDPSKMRSAVAPNFVHSLDASLAGKVALRMQDAGNNFVSIHDSFGTTPGQVREMRNYIREELYKLFTEQDPLDQFREAVHPEAELPERGDFDCSLVLQSEFCFS